MASRIDFEFHMGFSIMRDTWGQLVTGMQSPVTTKSSSCSDTSGTGRLLASIVLVFRLADRTAGLKKMPERQYKACLVVRMMMHPSDQGMLAVKGITQQLVKHGIGNLHTLALSRSLTSLSTNVRAVLVSRSWHPCPRPAVANLHYLAHSVSMMHKSPPGKAMCNITLHVSHHNKVHIIHMHPPCWLW